MSLQNLYDRTCDIYTQGNNKNNMAEMVETKTLLASAVACRMRRLTGKDMIWMDNIAAYISVRVYLDPRTDCEEWDYIVIDSVEYKISSFNAVHGKSGVHHISVDCYIEKRI